MLKIMANLSNQSPGTEYFVDIDESDGLFNYASNRLSVISTKWGSPRYNLNSLMKSDAPEHKEILKSLILNTLQKNLYGGFKALLYKNYQISPLNDDNQTALHLAFYSGASGIITEFGYYLESEYFQESNLSEYTDKNGLTHLHVACAKGSTKLIEIYSKNSANINRRFSASSEPEKRYNGFTPLHFAMINGYHQNKEMVQLLIERGADIDAVDDLGRTPLHLISSFSHTKFYWYRDDPTSAMEALIALKANVNAEDANGNIPLFMVLSSLDEIWLRLRGDHSYRKLIPVVEQKLKVLLEAGSDVNAKNNNNDTILHFAVGNLKITRQKPFDSTFIFDDARIIKSLELITSHRPDIDVNVRNENGETPLLIAVSYLSATVVKFLLKYNADPKSLKFDDESDKFFKPYGVSAPKSIKNFIAILKLLEKRGMVPKPEDKLALLKFLVPDKGRSIGYERFNSATFHIICIEWPERLESMMRNFYIDFRYDFLQHYESSEEYLDRFDELRRYLSCIETGDVFMYQYSYSLIKAAVSKCIALDNSGPPSYETEEIYRELDKLDSITLMNGKTMGEMLMEKPEKSAQFFGTNEFDRNQLKKLRYFSGIVVGYEILCLIRYHVINLSYDIVKNLHCTPLPYLCYEVIVIHLSNKDILNLCVAILT